MSFLPGITNLDLTFVLTIFFIFVLFLFGDSVLLPEIFLDFSLGFNALLFFLGTGFLYFFFASAFDLIVFASPSSTELFFFLFLFESTLFIKELLINQ